MPFLSDTQLDQQRAILVFGKPGHGHVEYALTEALKNAGDKPVLVVTPNPTVGQGHAQRERFRIFQITLPDDVFLLEREAKAAKLSTEVIVLAGLEALQIRTLLSIVSLGKTAERQDYGRMVNLLTASIQELFRLGKSVYVTCDLLEEEEDKPGSLAPVKTLDFNVTPGVKKQLLPYFPEAVYVSMTGEGLPRVQTNTGLALAFRAPKLTP